MRKLATTVFILYTGCAQIPPDAAREDDAKSGEVSQLNFTSDGNRLVVVNQYRPFGNSKRQLCHTRLRSVCTTDWKVYADTGELALVYVDVATSSHGPWMIKAKNYDRFGGGNPIGGPAFYKLDPVTLERKPVDVIQRGRDNIAFSPAAITRSDDGPLCAVSLIQYLSAQRSPQPQATFIFDIDTSKKVVALQDFPNYKHEYFLMRTVLGFVPGGKRIVSCKPCKPFQLQLRACDSGAIVKSVNVESAVGAVAFSPTGKKLAALCWDGTVLILEPDLSRKIQSLTVGAPRKGWEFANGVAFAGNDHLAVVSRSTKIELFETKSWTRVRTFDVEKNRVNCLATSPDGKLLAAGYGQIAVTPGRVRVFEVKTGKLVADLE